MKKTFSPFLENIIESYIRLVTQVTLKGKPPWVRIPVLEKVLCHK